MKKTKIKNSILIMAFAFMTLAPIKSQANIWAGSLWYFSSLGWLSAAGAAGINGDHEESNLSMSVFNYTMDLSQSYITNVWTTHQSCYMGQGDVMHYLQSGTFNNGTQWSNTNEFAFTLGKANFSCYAYDTGTPKTWIVQGSTLTINSTFRIKHTITHYANYSSGAPLDCAMFTSFDSTPTECGAFTPVSTVNNQVNTSFVRDGIKMALAMPSSNCQITSYSALKSVAF